MSEILGELKAVEEKKLPSELFTKNNIDVKTEISNPISITTLEIMSEYLKDYSPTISNYIKQYVKRFKINMVSYKRKSREEFVDSLKNVEIVEKETEQANKLLKV